MNCHEVMELMQRQLDEELSEADRERWTAHSRQCPDCTEKLELLKLVSLELTSLPKVTPRYSLVDSILPELDQLDRLKQQESAPLTSDTNKAVPIKSTPSKFSWKAFSAVVAAAAVCGIFIATYPSGGHLNKEDSMPIAANLANTARSELSQSAPFTASNSPGESKAGKVGTESYMGDFDISKEDYLVKTNQDTGKEEADRQSSPVASSKRLVKENGTGAQAEGAKESEQESLITGLSKQQFVDDLPGNESSLSPNEQFIASVLHYSVVVETANKEYVIMQTDRKNGKLMNFVWSEDSKSLTYEVHMEQGAIIKYIIDLEQLEERRAKS